MCIRDSPSAGGNTGDMDGMVDTDGMEDMDGTGSMDGMGGTRYAPNAV